MHSSFRSPAHSLAACLGLALCCASTAGVAQEQRAATQMPAFELLDRNGDNRLSRTEAGYNRQLLDIFVDSDVDGDGFVTRSEFESATTRGKADG
ncbi:EF-hand domain-containing protein [Povalibacter sp.]|uniref:EF-hand domain-containing protein n=1 Tax=Povalibacter sp. TaxID=1962978 RepID=UPI002F41E6D7